MRSSDIAELIVFNFVVNFDNSSFWNSESFWEVFSKYSAWEYWNWSSLQLRARQNVVFEHGLLIGLYTREKVICLVKKEGHIEMPGDVNGVVYTDHGYKDWRMSVAHMLSDAGYDINYRKINWNI